MLAEKFRIKVEEEKEASMKGKYLHPKAFRAGTEAPRPDRD